jgi:hypothetical protein
MRDVQMLSQEIVFLRGLANYLHQAIPGLQRDAAAAAARVSGLKDNMNRVLLSLYDPSGVASVLGKEVSCLRKMLAVGNSVKRHGVVNSVGLCKEDIQFHPTVLVAGVCVCVCVCVLMSRVLIEIIAFP